MAILRGSYPNGYNCDRCLIEEVEVAKARYLKEMSDLMNGVSRMNLIEAVKSGRPFKRPDWDFYHKLHELEVETDLSTYFDLNAEELLADDYELEPEKKPRRVGWTDQHGGVYLFLETDGWFEGYTRAPWLDEPEEK